MSELYSVTIQNKRSVQYWTGLSRSLSLSATEAAGVPLSKAEKVAAYYRQTQPAKTVSVVPAPTECKQFPEG